MREVAARPAKKEDPVDMRDRVFLIGAIVLVAGVVGYLAHRHYAEEEAVR